MIEIRHRATGVVLLQVDAETLQGADLAGVNLAGADLSGLGEVRHALRYQGLVVGVVLLGLAAGLELSHFLVGLAALLASRAAGRKEEAGPVTSNLAGANLQGAGLVGADLRGANLAGADLRGACLIGAQVDWATNLKGVRYDPSTQWPLGLRPQRAGARLVA